MVESGITLDQLAIDEFQKVKKKEYRYLVLRFNSKAKKEIKKVVVAEKGGKDGTFEELMENVDKDQVNFIFYNCYYTKNGDTQEKDKLISVTFISDLLPAVVKMLGPSTQKKVQTKCEGAAKYVIINDIEEMTEDNFINIVSENKSK